MIKSSFKLKFVPAGILICLLASMFPLKAENYYDYLHQNKNSQQLQETSINLNVNDLQTANILRIVKVDNLNNGNLKGEVKLGGEKIKEINSNSTEINLSSLLKQGTNILEISGSYTPINSSIKVEFSGSDTLISQETGGSGKLNQRLIIKIK
jgi:hypothetical protein